MKILVLSDSHKSMRFMRMCVFQLQPDIVIHLGDFYDDGEQLAEELPKPIYYQVPGNCDINRPFIRDPEIRVEKIAGVWMYLTHGHRHMVKTNSFALSRDARAAGAKIALFGHTHEPVCRQEEDGLWVLNPGSCGRLRPTAGWIEVQQGQIVSCRILDQELGKNKTAPCILSHNML